MNDQPKNGQAVKLIFGMGRTEYGYITNVLQNSWGISYEITTQEGEIEYVSTFGGVGMGAYIIGADEMPA